MIHQHNQIHKTKVNSYLDSQDDSTSEYIFVVENSFIEYPQDNLLIFRGYGIISRGL